MATLMQRPPSAATIRAGWTGGVSKPDPMTTPEESRAPAPMRPGTDPRGLGGGSSLGGYDPRPLSARGPMRPPAGVGTNNPNAVRVGPIRAPGERELQRQARRGNWRAAGILYGTATGQAHDREMQGAREASQQSRYEQERQDRRYYWQEGQNADREREDRAAGRADAQWDRETQRREKEAADERQWREQQWQREQAARGNPGDVRAVPVPGTDYVVPISGNQAMGTLPVTRPPGPAMSQEEIDQATGRGARVKVKRPGGEEVTYEPPAASPGSRLQRIPAVPGNTVNDPGTPERVFDPIEGIFYEPDENGQWQRSGQVPRGGSAGGKTPYNPFKK